jgi:hypothetical protein
MTHILQRQQEKRNDLKFEHIEIPRFMQMHINSPVIHVYFFYILSLNVCVCARAFLSSIYRFCFYFSTTFDAYISFDDLQEFGSI